MDHHYEHILNHNRPPAIVNGGALVNLVIMYKIPSTTYWEDPPVVMSDFAEIAVLLCRDGTTGSRLAGLALHKWGDRYCSRTKELFLLDTFVRHTRFEFRTRSRRIMPHRPFRLYNGDILIRKWIARFKGMELHRVGRGPTWRLRCYGKVLRLEENSPGDEDIQFFYETESGHGFAITLKRLFKRRDPLGHLMVSASLTKSRGTQVGDGMETTIEWVPKKVASLSEREVAHVMRSHSDSCQLMIGDQIRIDARVDRMSLGQGGQVDVMDMAIYQESESLAARLRLVEELGYGPDEEVGEPRT